jgi:hypothetical protein
MNKLLVFFAVLSTSNTFAMPNPQVVSLVNTAEFGKYVGTNIREIIGSSIELAKKAAPNRHYFLVTTSIEINAIGRDVDQGKKPFATLNMEANATALKCSRDVYAHVKADEYGEKREISFSLSDDIRCQ